MLGAIELRVLYNSVVDLLLVKPNPPSTHSQVSVSQLCHLDEEIVKENRA